LADFPPSFDSRQPKRLDMTVYRLHDTRANDLGLFQHPAPNLEPGDVLLLEDGREALVTARAEMGSGRASTALLEVVVTPWLAS
jgi:hypothetical protein